MSERWRLFVAIELPEDARAAIVRAVEALPAVPAIRRTPADQLHLTVLFLGAVAPDGVSLIEERLEGVAAEARPFDTTLTGFGAFPPRGPARTLWVGVRDADGSLAALSNAIRNAVLDLVVTEERSFRAHVTVARARTPVRLPRVAMETAVEPVRFEVDHLTLFRSHLGGGEAARYEPLGRWRLGAETP
jgi:2'-5' RNA ligase